MPVVFTTPVTLNKRVKSGEDAYGNDVFVSTPTTVAGVFAPGGSSEQVQGQDVVVTQPTVYLLTGTDVDAVDSLTVAGRSYEVDGDPSAWPPNPFTGWQPEYSVEVRLRRVS